MSQRHTAKGILDKVLEDEEIIREFLEKEHTDTVYHSRRPPGENARTAAYNAQPDNQPFNLLRLLCVRDLAIDYMHIWQRSKLQGRRYGTIDGFVQKRGLPDGITRKALKIGQKLIDLENQCGISGVSLVLLPAWYMFEHFSEIEELARLLLSDQLDGLRSYSVSMSAVLSTYQELYLLTITSS
jgi:hypothetical protein